MEDVEAASREIEKSVSSDLEKVETMNKLLVDWGKSHGVEKNCHKTDKNRRSVEPDQRDVARWRLAARNKNLKKIRILSLGQRCFASG